MSLEVDGQVIATAEFREHAGADGRGASSSELVLKPGDGLYVPMWMPHRACASDQGVDPPGRCRQAAQDTGRLQLVFSGAVWMPLRAIL